MKCLVSQGCSDAGHGSCCSGHEAVPVSVDAQVVPVDPGQSGGEVRGVPVNTARGPQLTSQTLKTNRKLVKDQEDLSVYLLNVDHRLQVTEEDLPQQADVGDGQSQGVNLAEPLLIRKGWNVSPQLLKCRVDAGAAKIE